MLSSLIEPCALPYHEIGTIYGWRQQHDWALHLVHELETNRPFYSFSDAKPHADIVSEADSNDGRSSG